jgi:predicted dehydrogenase
MTFPQERALRVGISGYGLAGRVFHAPLLASCGFEVVGAVTNNPERIDQFSKDFPGAQVFDSIHSLVTQELDLVVVASGNTAHVSDAIAAMSAGMHVVIDKPVGLNLTEVQQVAASARTYGVGAIPFFNRRWDSDALTIKKVIAEGVLGEIFRLDSRFERFRPGSTPKNWREEQSAAQGGGLLLDLQPHLISTALDWFGPAELGYSSVREIRGMSDDDVTVVLNHASGVDSYLSASAIIGAPGPRIRLSGSNGTLIINELDGQEALLREGKKPLNGIWSEPVTSVATLHRGDEVISYPSIGGNYGAFYLAIEAGIRSGAAWPVTIEEALAVTQILDQARLRSAHQ